MLTRLKVSGFKNLVDVDVRFGAFTCVAGANGVGKSNLFDAIRFLSALASKPLVEAALSVRDEGGRTSDLRSLFHRVGDSYDERMRLEAEMIVPREAVDDLGQRAKASITFLRYSLELGYRNDEGSARALGSLEILREKLVHITQGESAKHLLFPHDAAHWRKGVVVGRRSAASFISTETEGGARLIKLHQDGGSSGRPLSRSAVNLPRTVLSVANAAESPTVLCARREMESWQLLQLEPAALRRPDELNAPARLTSQGLHLPATLYRLAHEGRPENFKDAEHVYGQITNRLAELIDDVRGVYVDRDDRRELLTLFVTGHDRTQHPARSLSDGTLRFLALAVMEMDPAARGVLCLEEPENGIHPERIPAMISLLREIATDPMQAVDSTNPLRQVIINTHSPSVVSEVPDISLLVAERSQAITAPDLDGATRSYPKVRFGALPRTWRVVPPAHAEITPKGALLAYLNPLRAGSSNGEMIHGVNKVNRLRAIDRRVIDNPDLQALLPLGHQ